MPLSSPLLLRPRSASWPSRSWRVWPVLVGAVLLVLPRWSAAEALTPDRPDFVDSPEVVGAGRFQLETGLSLVKDRDRGAGLRVRQWTAPVLLRYGVSDTLEFRLESDGDTRVRSRDEVTGVVDRERGHSDATIGVKWKLRSGGLEHGGPSVAWLANLTLDTGSAAFRGQGVRPSLRVVGEWELAPDLSVAVMPGVLMNRDAAGRRYVAGILAVTVGKDLGGRWKGFVELAGQHLASRRHGGKVLSFDTGLAYAFTESIQADLMYGRGLNDQTPDHTFGTGVSIRF